MTMESGRATQGWAPDNERMKGKRDRALLALLLACGLRSHEAVSLRLYHLRQREEHWAIVDLLGKGGHIRTVPIPHRSSRLSMPPDGIERLGRAKNDGSRSSLSARIRRPRLQKSRKSSPSILC